MGKNMAFISPSPRAIGSVSGDGGWNAHMEKTAVLLSGAYSPRDGCWAWERAIRNRSPAHFWEAEMFLNDFLICHICPYNNNRENDSDGSQATFDEIPSMKLDYRNNIKMEITQPRFVFFFLNNGLTCFSKTYMSLSYRSPIMHEHTHLL